MSEFLRRSAPSSALKSGPKTCGMRWAWTTPSKLAGSRWPPRAGLAARRGGPPLPGPTSRA
eukprot:7837112-Pyramimonas_sp.AAC.1